MTPEQLNGWIVVIGGGVWMSLNILNRAKELHLLDIHKNGEKAVFRVNAADIRRLSFDPVFWSLLVSAVLVLGGLWNIIRRQQVAIDYINRSERLQRDDSVKINQMHAIIMKGKP